MVAPVNLLDVPLQVLTSGGWLGINLTVLFGLFLIATLFYMIALAFSLDELKKWVKSEYMELLASLLLLGLITVFIYAFWSGAVLVTYVADEASRGNIIVDPQSASPPPDVSPFSISQDYMNHLIRCERAIYQRVYLINAIIEPIEKSTTMIAGVEATSGWPLSGLVNFAHYICELINYLLMTQYFQLHLLGFSRATMLTIFLPLGLVLRSIPLTRGTGSLLMAVSIGFFIVYPLSYVALAATQGGMQTSCFGAYAATPQEAANIVNQGAPFQESDLEYRCNDNPSEVVIQEQQINLAVNDGSIYNWYQRLIDSLNLIYLQSIFFPFVAFTITFTFIRSTASILGADIMEISQGFIRFI